MMGKLLILAGVGAGYVLGARAGRDRYDQIAGTAQQLWGHPQVRGGARRAQHAVSERVGLGSRSRVGSEVSS